MPRGNRIGREEHPELIDDEDVWSDEEDPDVDVSELYADKKLQGLRALFTSFAENNLPITTKDIRRFNRIWSRLARARFQYYDENNPNLSWLHVAQLPALLSRLMPPLRPVLSREAFLELVENKRADQARVFEPAKVYYETAIEAAIGRVAHFKAHMYTLDGSSAEASAAAYDDYSAALTALSALEDEQHDLLCYAALQIAAVTEQDVDHRRILLFTIDELRIPSDGLFVHYVDVLYRLALHAMSRHGFGGKAKDFLVHQAVKDEFMRVIRTTIWNDDVKNVNKNIVSEATLFKNLPAPGQSPAVTSNPSASPAAAAARDSVISGPVARGPAIPGATENRLHLVKARQSVSAAAARTPTTPRLSVDRRGSVLAPAPNPRRPSVLANYSRSGSAQPSMVARPSLTPELSMGGRRVSHSLAEGSEQQQQQQQQSSAAEQGLCLTPLAAVMTSVDKFVRVVPATFELHGEAIQPQLNFRESPIGLEEAHMLTPLEALERVVDQIPEDDVKLECLRAEAHRKFPELFSTHSVINAGLLLRIIKVQRLWRLQSARRIYYRNLARQIREREELEQREQSGNDALNGDTPQGTPVLAAAAPRVAGLSVSRADSVSQGEANAQEAASVEDVHITMDSDDVNNE
jgi:hypothetical protein